MRYMDGPGDNDEDLSATQLEAWDRRRTAPVNEVPAGLDLAAVLGRTDETAVSVTGFLVYTNGIAFTLSVRLRREPLPDLGHRIYELVSGDTARHPEGSVDERLLLGVEYADGRTAMNLTSSHWPLPFEQGASEEPLMTAAGGGGGGRTYDYGFWLSPVPPTGPLTFVCHWPMFGIEETHTELDGAQMVAALARVQSLWPWEPDDPQPMPEPAQPQVPADGWFAKTLRKQNER